MQPSRYRGEKSNSSQHVTGMEVEKKPHQPTHPQLKPCVLVDGTAPERLVEAVCAAQMQPLWNALD